MLKGRVKVVFNDGDFKESQAQPVSSYLQALMGGEDGKSSITCDEHDSISVSRITRAMKANFSGNRPVGGKPYYSSSVFFAR